MITASQVREKVKEVEAQQKTKEELEIRRVIIEVLPRVLEQIEKEIHEAVQSGWSYVSFYFLPWMDRDRLMPHLKMALEDNGFNVEDEPSSPNENPALKISWEENLTPQKDCESPVNLI